MSSVVYSTSIMEQDKKHVRRVRYKGTHPKTFKEKYKEHQPDKYQDTIEKVISKGNTPAGMHISIMVNEILECLKIKPGEIGLDATLGYGGHTLKMLESLNGSGHIYGLDIDPIEITKTKERLNSKGFDETILSVVNLNFKDIDLVSQTSGGFDFILADLGVSSMQIDDPDRGFSFKRDGDLDLRLNPNVGIPAKERIKQLKVEELEGMLIENADEPYAFDIATAIVSEIKKGNKIDTTLKLKEVIVNSLDFLPKNNKDEVIKKTCQRVFQAIRIDVNDEYEVLYEFLEKLPKCLKPNGRVVILTFHSGEDRLVKKSFKQLYRSGVYSDISTEVIRPSLEECSLNSRAKSTKLRYAIKS